MVINHLMRILLNYDRETYSQFIHCSINVLELDTSFYFNIISGLHYLEYSRSLYNGLKCFILDSQTPG